MIFWRLCVVLLVLLLAPVAALSSSKLIVKETGWTAGYDRGVLEAELSVTEAHELRAIEVTVRAENSDEFGFTVQAMGPDIGIRILPALRRHDPEHFVFAVIVPRDTERETAALVCSFRCELPSRRPAAISAQAIDHNGNRFTLPINYQALPSEGPARPPRITQWLTSAPNPSAGAVELRYFIENGGEVELTVYDVIGRRVSTVFSGRRVAGEHRGTWSGRTQGDRRITSGIYWAVLKTTQGLTTRKLVIIR